MIEEHKLPPFLTVFIGLNAGPVVIYKQIEVATQINLQACKTAEEKKTLTSG